MPQIINLKEKAILKADIIPLYKFFKSQARMSINVWKKETIYHFDNGRAFVFKNDVFRRESHSRSGQFRYEVISNKVVFGQGAYGIVKLIKRTVAFGEGLDGKGSIRFKKKGKEGKRRAVKIACSVDGIDDLRYEYASGAPHCGFKRPVEIDVGSSTQRSYLAMRRHPGQNLSKILDYRQALTTAQRLALSKELLRALKTQVTAPQLIHRDIKPQNIMVEMGPSMIINIIDYGFSRERGTFARASGSLPYLAPEHIYQGIGRIGDKSDIYSMARVIALVWNVDFSVYGHDSYRMINPDSKLLRLFDGIADLNEIVKAMIKKTLIAMLSYDPTARLSLDKAIIHFDQIERCWANSQLGYLAPVAQESIDAGAREAVDLRSAATTGKGHTAPSSSCCVVM